MAFNLMDEPAECITVLTLSFNKEYKLLNFVSLFPKQEFELRPPITKNLPILHTFLTRPYKIIKDMQIQEQSLIFFNNEIGAIP
jgi:hypothetical protein